MSLGVLNNISAIYAQNNLANTQASLSKTLQQLSSGSRINSGADDAAGLSLANGLQASATALSQSAKNASEGVDFLQVADGALSQVTSLLNRAITLATEASNGTLNTTQQGAADSEYQKILTEINTIGANTEYNGINVFNNAANVYTSDGSTTQTYAGVALGSFNSGTIGLGGTVLNVVVGTTAVGTGQGGKDSLGNTIGANDLVMTDASSTDTYNLTALGVAGASTGTTAFAYSGTSGAYSARDITGSDIAPAAVAGTDYAGNPITAGDQVYTDGAGNMYDLGGTAATSQFIPTGTNAATSLGTASGAQSALSLVNAAIKTVAADRGTLGANINTLTAVGNVMTMQSTNTLAAENDVTATDYGQATSDMSKYQILSQTGIAALSQANQAQQLITKLLQ